jgi:sugar/nucleoside kinase (ribokinase family)
LSTDPDAPQLDASVELVEVREQLGGMAAGFALALGGRLVTPFGDDSQAPRLREILGKARLPYTECVASAAATDTTDLILSDTAEKLAIGTRDASLRIGACKLLAEAESANVIIVAGLPNNTAAHVLKAAGGWTVFAPSLRNARGPDFVEAAREANMLTLNEREWQAAGSPDELRTTCDCIVVTRGPRGARALLAKHAVEVPALRPRQIQDPNRAGEAFAAGFVAALLEHVDAPQLSLSQVARDRTVVLAALRAASVMARLQLATRRTEFAPRRTWLAARSELLPER